MLQYIKDLLTSFVEAFSSVFDFFKDFINELVNFFKLIAQGVTYLFDVINVLPPFITAFAILGVTLSVLYLILGRGNNQ